MSPLVLSGHSFWKKPLTMSWRHTQGALERGLCEQTSRQRPAPIYQTCEWASSEVNPLTSVKPSEDPEQKCSAKVAQNSRSSETIYQLYCCFKPLSIVVICFRTIGTNTELPFPFSPSDFSGDSCCLKIPDLGNQALLRPCLLVDCSLFTKTIPPFSEHTARWHCPASGEGGGHAISSGQWSVV